MGMEKYKRGYKDLPLMPVTDTPSTANQTGFWKTYKPVFNKEKCIKCRNCFEVCKFGAVKYGPKVKNQ